MTQSLQDHVATEIRAELARKRMTQSELCVALGRSNPYMTRRLNGEVAFDTAEIEQIAEVLGVPVTKFLPRPAVGVL